MLKAITSIACPPLRKNREVVTSGVQMRRLSELLNPSNDFLFTDVHQSVSRLITKRHMEFAVAYFFHEDV
jgi:hypothetical protein